MEYIIIEDVRAHIETLKKYVRPVGMDEHPTLVEGDVRPNDYKISADGKFIEPGPSGLSFATSMKQFKYVVRMKGRFFQEVMVNAIDDTTPLPSFLRIIRDGGGHASLIVISRIERSVLVSELEKLASRVERIGIIKVTP